PADLPLAVHRRLSVLRIIEPLIALLPDLGFGVGEVRLRLVLGRRVNRRRLPAAPPPALRFPLGARLITTMLLGCRRGARLGFQPRLRRADLGQPILAPLQLLGQLVTAPAPLGRVLLGVESLGVPE